VKCRSEQQIQKSILDHLAWRGLPELFAFHVPNGGYRPAVEAKIFKSLGVIPGVPDVLILYRGRLHALELKTKGGRLTETQRRTHEDMRRAGAFTATCYGVDDALLQLETWGLLRGDAQ
jgi:VRR-NUC domain-containing protein